MFGKKELLGEWVMDETTHRTEDKHKEIATILGYGNSPKHDFTVTPEELNKALKDHYNVCKRGKMDSAALDWSVWSGQFNRFHRALSDVDNELWHPISALLFAMWGVANRLLSLHKSMLPLAKKKKKEVRLMLQLNKDFKKALGEFHAKSNGA